MFGQGSFPFVPAFGAPFGGAERGLGVPAGGVDVEGVVGAVVVGVVVVGAADFVVVVAVLLVPGVAAPAIPTAPPVSAAVARVAPISFEIFMWSKPPGSVEGCADHRPSRA